jgi:hypothetical protein
MDRERITGAELDISKGPSRRKFTDHVVRFGASFLDLLEFLLKRDSATRRHISWSHCKNLEDAIERSMAGEQLTSESESESPKRRKSKPRARAARSPSDIEAESSEGSDSAVDELQELEEADACTRTRSSGLGVPVKQEEKRKYTAYHHLPI